MPVCRFCDYNAPVGAKNCPSCGAELPEALGTPAATDLESELLALVDAGNMIGAIKRYREATGADLLRAKEHVEALKATRSLPAGVIRPSAGPEFEAEVLNLVASGRKIEAIKVYRERTGVGLKEAKDAVEALAARRGVVTQKSGCLGVIVLCAAASGIVASLV
jgi:large subunit ribosomal protein L7/L12